MDLTLIATVDIMEPGHYTKDNCGGNELGIFNIDSKCGRNGNGDIKDLMESGYLDLMEFGYQR